MTRLQIGFIALWLVGFAIPASGQTPVLRAVDASGPSGGLAVVPIELDVPVDTMAGVSFGVCHDSAALSFLSTDLGATLAAFNGGTGPEFIAVTPFPGSGFTIGVVLDFNGVLTVPPGFGYELILANYEVLTEGVSTVTPCGTLGVPSVALVVSLPGGISVTPDVESGTVTGTPPAGTFRRGDLDGNGMRDEADFSLLQEWIFGTPSAFGAADPPLGCDLVPNQSGDINDNEFETIADLLLFREYLDCGPIFIPSPSELCGDDPDEDTGGFETPDPDYIISALTISITGDVDQERDVEIFLQVLSPTTVKAVSLGLELGSQLSPAAVPLTVANGVTADFFDSIFDGTHLVVGAGSTQCATPMLGGSVSFQPLGTLHLKLAPFAIFPPAQYRSSILIEGRNRWTTVVDEQFQDHNPFTISGTFEFARGNSNNVDALVNIADSVWTLQYLFPNPTGVPLECEDAADANNDGMINIADPIFTLAFLFSGGPPIPAPFPQCGFDIDIDLLGCDGAICP